MDRSDYIARAVDCERAAQKTSMMLERQEWLKLAQSWRFLAGGIEKSVRFISRDDRPIETNNGR